MNFPGECSEYHGFPMHTFSVDGCECMVVEPLKPRSGNPWVWKAEFFTAFPTFELAMLERGFHLAYMTVGNTFGCPSALKHWDVFYAELIGRFGLAKRAVLLGLSRGGLYIYNWAVRNPEKVACLYADNPVCDFKSWPGGKGIGPGSPDDWQKLLRDYGFRNEAEALAWPGNPVDAFPVLVKASIPLIHAVGMDDEVVPVSENTDILEARCKKLGGRMTVFRHPGKHHPHGLEDPAPLIDVLLRETGL